MIQPETRRISVRPVHPATYPCPAESAWAEGEAVAASSASITYGKDYTVSVLSKNVTAGQADIKVKVECVDDANKGDAPMVYLIDETGASVSDAAASIDELGKGTAQEFTLSGTFAAGTYRVIVKDVQSSGYGNPSASLANECAFDVYPVAETPETAFANGKAVAGVDQDGFAVTPDSKGVFTIAADGTNEKYVVPTSVMPEGATKAVDVVLKDGATLKNNFFADSNGAPNSTAISSMDDLKNPGTYWVSVVPEDNTGWNSLYVKFVVTASQLEGATAYVVNAKDAFDTSDTEMVYDGDDWSSRIGFALNGVAVPTKSVTFYNAKGQAVDDDSVATGAQIVNAGKYTAVITGADNTVYEGEVATVSFEIAKLDLSKAVLAVEDVVYNGTTVTVEDIVDGASVNGSKDFPSDVLFSAGPVAKVGQYTATFYCADDDTNVTGSGTAKFNAVKAEVAAGDYKYGNVALSTLEGSVFDLGRAAFDLSDVWVDNDDVDYEVALYNAKGDKVDAADAYGAYTLVVSIVPGSDYALGGKQVVNFTVAPSASLVDATVTFAYDGEVYGSDPITYTGSDVLGDFAVTVKVGNKTLVEGTDYEIVALDKSGKEIEEAVEVGSYTLVVKGINYSGSVSKSFSIEEAQITNLRVANDGIVAWTGEAVTPVVEYTTEGKWGLAATDANDDTTYAYVAPEDAEWTVLPADQFIATYVDVKTGKTVKAEDLKAEGSYTVKVTLNSKAENVKFAATGTGGDTNVAVDAPLSFKISKAIAFSDVSTSAWYADSVALASSKGYEYMTGIAGTKLFMPEASITRAEVAQVFANMAGQEKNTDGTEYPTKFSDVEASAWYAKAIAWASQAGIVTGYEGTSSFGTFDNANREQIATMIYRYAKAQGMDVTVEDEAAALAKYADGASVSEYAKAAMAWCVEQGIMGVDTDTLRPQAEMSRAEMAATSVRVQPDGRIEAIA